MSSAPWRGPRVPSTLPANPDSGDPGMAPDESGDCPYSPPPASHTLVPLSWRVICPSPGTWVVATMAKGSVLITPVPAKVSPPPVGSEKHPCQPPFCVAGDEVVPPLVGAAPAHVV